MGKYHILMVSSAFALCVLKCWAFTFDPFAKIIFSANGKPVTISKNGPRVKSAASINRQGLLTDPIHETMTLRALERIPSAKICPGIQIPDDNVIREIVIGSRWNDDPHNYLSPYNKYPATLVNWIGSMQDAESLSRRGRITTGYDLLYRSHYLDLQFLHAMAQSYNEGAAETQEKMLMWAEYAYRVSTGEIAVNEVTSASQQRFKSELRKTFFGQTILAGKGRGGWTPAFLFDSSCNRFKPQFPRHTVLVCTDNAGGRPGTKLESEKEGRVKSVALGSILHLLEDSYSASHVVRMHNNNSDDDGFATTIRDAGAIVEFEIYGVQNHHSHALADSWPTDYAGSAVNEDCGSLCDFASEIAACSLKDGANRKSESWPEIEAFLRSGPWKLIDPNQHPAINKYTLH